VTRDCPHPETTFPDEQGYRICLVCADCVRVPLTQAELDQRLLAPPAAGLLTAYCLRGVDCGNPFQGGRFLYDAAEPPPAERSCPRCGGPATLNQPI
jgi:hypothetical protein